MTRAFIVALVPDTATRFTAAREGTVIGGYFRPGAIVFWRDSSRPTTFVSASELRWTISASDLSYIEPVLVRVRNPAPDTTASNALPFYVENAFGLATQEPRAGSQINADTPIRAYFHRALDPASLTTSSFTARDSANGLDVTATVTADASTKSAVLNASLEYDRTYDIRVTTALRSIRGDQLPAAASWRLYTPLGRVTRLADRAYFPSLAIALNGTLHAAYFGSTPTIDLRMAFASCAANCGDSTSWQYETPVTVGANYVTFGIDAQGRRHVAFQDYASLKYGTAAAGGTWEFVMVDPSVETGAFADLEVEPGGRVHIVHQMSPAGHLLYAVCSSNCAAATSWTSYPIDTVGNVGAFGSVALGQAGVLHVVYHAYDSWDLRYATCSGGCETGSWQIATIDAAGAVGWGNSLAVDGAGTLHVAGFDYTNGTVRYGRCSATCINPASWTFGAVAQVANPGTAEPHGFYYVRMSAHNVGITLAFEDRRSGELFTADCAGSCAAATWTIRRASRLLDVGLPTAWYPSIVVDGNGWRHILFGSLRYTRFQ